MWISFLKQPADDRRLTVQQSKWQLLSMSNYRKMVRKSKPFTTKKIKVAGCMYTWSSGFHGKVSNAETDAPMASSFFYSRILLLKHVLSIELHLPPATLPEVHSHGRCVVRVDITRLFGGGQQPYSSPDWTTSVNIPITFFLQPCYFNRSFP